MSLPHDISQRDLRMRSREIMDAVENGQTLTVTRDGRQIAELIPLRPRRLVPAADFLAASAHAPVIDYNAMRRELDDIIDPYITDPYARLCAWSRPSPCLTPMSLSTGGTCPPTASQATCSGERCGGRSASAEVLAALRATPQMTGAELSDSLGVSRRTIDRRLRSLQAEGQLRREGSTKAGRWVVVDSQP
ncbi:MAG: HTH domain-containing protein [Candidatus Nanopelagicales bacterium]